MKSLEDLNNKAGSDLQEFTDFRASNVVWDIKNYQTNYAVNQDENTYISLPFPLRILEIVNYQTANVRLEFDFSNTTGNIDFDKSWPSWATVTETNRVVTVSGFQHNLHFNELYNLNQRVRLNGYFGTASVTVKFLYVRSGVNDQRPWTLNLNIDQVLNLTSPQPLVFYGIATPGSALQSISAPFVQDPANLGVNWRMEIEPSISAGFDQLSVPNTSGATVVYNSTTKTLTIEGTQLQVNEELAGLTGRFGVAEEDFDLTFNLTDIFDDSTAGLVTDLKVTRYRTATTGLELNRQWQFNDTNDESLEKPFRDGQVRLFAPAGASVELTVSVPNNAFRYYQDLNTLTYSLETTSHTFVGFSIAQLQTIISGLWYKASQTYAGEIEWVFTIKHSVNSVQTTVMNQYLYDMAGQYVIWDGITAGNTGTMTAPTIGGGPYYEGDVILGSNITWNGNNIVSIQNPNEANIVLTFDLAYLRNLDPTVWGDATGLILEWDNIPAGIVVNRTANNRYRVTGIDTPSDFDAMRNPTRIRTPNDLVADQTTLNVGIFAQITWIGGRQRNWTYTLQVLSEREFDQTLWETNDPNSPIHPGPLLGDQTVGAANEFVVDAIAFPRGYQNGDLPGPQIQDEGTLNPIYNVSIVPDKPDTISNISTTSNFSGLTFNNASKISSVSGSKSTVNDILSKLTVSFDMIHFEDQMVRYYLSNNLTDETDECYVWLESSGWDPVFRWDRVMSISPSISENNILKTDPIVFDETLEHAYIGSRNINDNNSPIWNPGTLTIGLYDSTYLTSLTVQNPVDFTVITDQMGNTSGYPNNIDGDIFVPNTVNFIYEDQGVVNPIDDLVSYDYISAGDLIYRADSTTVSQGSRLFTPTYFSPSQFFNENIGDIDGYVTFRNDPPALGYTTNGLEYHVRDSDDNGWIVLHEPTHYGNCISSNSNDTKIAISHAGEVYTDGIYFDEYYYGVEFTGVPGAVGSTTTGNFINTEWGDYFYATDDYTVRQNTYQGRHFGCVYIYTDQDTLHQVSATRPLPIQKIYPPVSDQPGDPLAAVGNYLLFGEYSNISPDGNRLVITCPGWQSGNVDGVSLKGAYTYTWNSISEQFVFDAVNAAVNIIDPQWNENGTRLVGEDRDDPTKLRIYLRNSNGSLSLNETLPLPASRPFRWDYSPVSETIVIAQTDGTVDVYEINQSISDYNKTQELNKGAVQNNTEIQISHDGLIVIWKIQGYNLSTDSGNNFTGWGTAVFYRSSVLTQFNSSINQQENRVDQLNGAEYNLIDFSTPPVGRSSDPTDYRNVNGAVFPLGNRLTITDRVAAPELASVDFPNRTATFTTGTNQTATFLLNGNQPDTHTEFRIEYTPDDSSNSVIRNYKYWWASVGPRDYIRQEWFLNALVDGTSPVRLNDITGGTEADL